jgi:hypothetical protein
MSTPRRPKPSFDLPSPAATPGTQPETAWIYRSAAAPAVRRTPSPTAIDGETPVRRQTSGLQRAVERLSFPLQMALMLGLAAGQIIREPASDTRRT